MHACAHTIRVSSRSIPCVCSDLQSIPYRSPKAVPVRVCIRKECDPCRETARDRKGPRPFLCRDPAHDTGDESSQRRSIQSLKVDGNYSRLSSRTFAGRHFLSFLVIGEYSFDSLKIFNHRDRRGPLCEFLSRHLHLRTTRQGDSPVIVGNRQ